MARRAYGMTDISDKKSTAHTGRRVYGSSVSLDSPVSQLNEPQQAVSAKPVSKRKTIIMASIMGVLLTSSAVFGILAIQSQNEVAEIVQAWDDVRNLATVTTNSMVIPVSSDDSDQFIITSPNQTAVSSSEAYVYDPIDREINWEALWQVNAQVKCWLYVPNTNIDYPVVQEAEIGIYHYLDHDLYDNELMSGCIVTPRQPDGAEDSDAHFIILGHNMKNATMFGTLKYYRDSVFCEENPYIYIYYPDHTEKWQVWSVYDTLEDDIIYDMPYELNTPAFEKLVKHINSVKKYETAIDNIDPSKRVLTLSTCYDFDNTKRGRFVVNCLLASSVENQ